MRHWQKYSGAGGSLEGKSILELGPGPDVGIGMILLSRSARKYTAIDVNPLVELMPREFIDRALERIGGEACRLSKNEVEKAIEGNGGRLEYICDPAFNLRALGQKSVDLVFSQAAIEHFDNVEDTFSQLAEVVRPGGEIVAEIDLATHTQCILRMDPLNIYRYPKALYNMLRFRGSPNRLLVSDYIGILQKTGWTNIQVCPAKTLGEIYFAAASARLWGPYKDNRELRDISIILCARREGEIPQ